MFNLLKVLLVLTSLLIGLTWSVAAAPPQQGPSDAAGQPSLEQQSMTGSPGVATQHAVVNFADLARKEASAPAAPREPKVIHPPLPKPQNLSGSSGSNGPGLATQQLSDTNLVALSPAPSSSFLALGDSNDAIPPDTHGAVGPNHLMVTLNTQVRIQNRSGGAISTVLLNNFWASVAGGTGTFDPKILYDPYSNRWIFTTCDNGQSTSSALLIGVSQTSDPTGNWNLYSIDADVVGPNNLWADYPSMGFNKDWIVVSLNMFTVSGNSFNRTQIYVFNKANLYANGAGLFTLLQDSSGFGFTQVPALTYDNTLSTMYLLEDFDNTSGQLRLSTITGAVGAETLTLGVAFPSTANTWNFSPPTTNFAPQLGSVQKINNNDSRLQNLVYRNGSLWTTHTVFLPAVAANHSAIQWWQLTTSGAIVQRSRIEASNTFYAFPTIAVNKDNAVLIGYSRFSATQYASANYSFRAASDPLNTLQTDTVLKAGEAPYFKDFGGGRNRWGDYSNTIVDPVNDTDMWTIQEYAATASGGFDRWGTWWGRIVPTTTPLLLTYLPIIMKTPSGGFVNGNFESGPTGWTQFSTHGWPLIVTTLPGVTPHSGSWAVWLGGDINDISYVQQQVTVPASSPYLAYYHWIASEDTCGFDFGGVIINGGTVVDAYNLCTSTATGGWVKHVVNLVAYAGQSVSLQIQAETDSSFNSNLFVDDVSFQSTATILETSGPNKPTSSNLEETLPKLSKLSPTAIVGETESEFLLRPENWTPRSK